MNFKKVLSVSMLAFALVPLSTLVTTNVAGAGTDRYVATSGSDVANNCATQATPCQTIQHAVNQSVAGDTVNVAAGIYAEQVKVITANLNITGPATGPAAIIQPAAAVVNSSSLYSGVGIAAIVVVDGVSGVTLDQMTIDGSVAGLSRSCQEASFVGVFYRAASGLISDNRVTGIEDPLNSGCQGYLGVFVQSGNGGPNLNSNVVIDGNTVDHYGKNGITANEAGTSVTVTGNTVDGEGPGWLAAQNGVQVGFGAHGKVTNNTITDNYYSTPQYVACGILAISGGGTIGQTKTNTFSGNSVNVCSGGNGPSANSPFNR
jgi:hypothetical protein